jgi:hypothetical protein
MGTPMIQALLYVIRTDDEVRNGVQAMCGYDISEKEGYVGGRRIDGIPPLSSLKFFSP